MAQLDMFGTAAPATPTADPERVRAKLRAFMDEVRNDSDYGLPDSRRRLIETVVPQMVRWLPEDEATSYRRAFAEALAAD